MHRQVQSQCSSPYVPTGNGQLTPGRARRPAWQLEQAGTLRCTCLHRGAAAAAAVEEQQELHQHYADGAWASEGAGQAAPVKGLKRLNCEPHLLGQSCMPCEREGVLYQGCRPLPQAQAHPTRPPSRLRGPAGRAPAAPAEGKAAPAEVAPRSLSLSACRWPAKAAGPQAEHAAACKQEAPR